MSPTNRLSETSTPVPASLQLRRIASLCCALLAGYFSLATSAAPVCYYEQKLAGHIDFRSGETTRVLQFEAEGHLLVVTISPAAQVHTEAPLASLEHHEGLALSREASRCPQRDTAENTEFGGGASFEAAAVGDVRCALYVDIRGSSQVAEIEVDHPEAVTRLSVEAAALVGGDCNENAVTTPHAVRLMGGLD